MALIHAATLEPSKHDAIAAWLPSQPWAPDDGEVRLVGAFRFDDPDGEVGIETHLVECGGVVWQVPLTFRGSPLVGGEHDLVATMQHSALGERWVYDGPGDPAYVRMLATATLTGVGQAAELQLAGEEQRTRPPTARLSGHGWITEPVRVDGWGAASLEDGVTVVRSPDLEVRLRRRPGPADGGGSDGPAVLLGTWAG